MVRAQFGLATLALALFVSPLLAAEDNTPSFKNRDADEKVFVQKVGRTVVKAGRTSVRDEEIKFINYDIKPDGANYHLRMRLEYAGRVTNTTYVSDINMKNDQSNKDGWKVVSIQYEDNNRNPIPANTKTVQALVDKFNR